MSLTGFTGLLFPSLLRRNSAEVEIKLDSHHDDKIYRPGTTVQGEVSITPLEDTRFNSVAVALLGTSKVRVETARSVRDISHVFLSINMPILQSLPPLFEASHTYSIPFSFVIPKHLTLSACKHENQSGAVFDQHMRLPPSMGYWSKDDLSPEVARVEYIIKAYVARGPPGSSGSLEKTMIAKHLIKVLPDPRRALVSGNMDHPSPFGPNPATPRYLNVNSPEATISGGQGLNSTPTAALILQSTLRARSNLLLQGRQEELLSGCNAGDRKVLTKWLHDYWMHSFVTAKFWGKGPQHWTPGLVSQVTLGASPFGNALAALSPAELISAPSPRTCEIPPPTSLCQWAVHYGQDPGLQYDVQLDRPIETQAEFDLNDQSSWTPWPDIDTRNRTLQRTMEESFAHSQFRTTPSDELPISDHLVAQAVSRSPQELALDSVAFAIMSGNLESVEKTLETSVRLLDGEGCVL
ncbi:hypothetical protein CPLU01_08003 [Colletotrichum plurivorum]|uniref:Arrestin n=1 Tax=Colletotrichum plurivorum TaxID=2175906 RepID=A0A8H6KEQ0_9PEZI|nr:hypothetical protein CPLU01_08003 [Colletotrichum plurivorum]